MEFEEVVTMDHEESSAGVDDAGERPDFRYVAWLLREKLNALVDGDQGEPPELELQSLLNTVASRKIISVDPKRLNPVLWRSLPKELLLLVFVRLAVPDILRLRSLSKEWSRDMATVNSEINRACDEISPTMVAGFSREFIRGKGSSNSEFLVTICDLSTHRSPYAYRLHLGDPSNDRWDDMVHMMVDWSVSSPHGYPAKLIPCALLLVNLLTGVQRKLPPLQYVYLSMPKMMHIQVDSETKCYRVVVVGKNMKGRPTVETYDSGAKQWTKATPPVGFLFGESYRWKYLYRISRSASITRAVYDFAGGQLKRYDGRGPSRGASVIKYAHHQDCVFVLHKNTSNGETLQAGGYCITEYLFQTSAEDWIQEVILVPSF